MNNQFGLFGDVVDVAPKTKIHMSWSDDETEIFRTISVVYNDGLPFFLDPTYGEAGFYKKFPEPELKFDKVPRLPGVEQGDCRNLPLLDGSIPSAIVDLPFLTGASKKGIMKDRYTKIPSMKALHELYVDTINEMYRVLSPNGILVMKCQDVVSGGITQFSHIDHVYVPAK